MRLTVVIPTWNLPRASRLASELAKSQASGTTRFCIVGGDGKQRGALEAMAEGARFIADNGGAADVIGFLHDDVEILEEGWDEKLEEFFRMHEKVGLVGFGGALGLGVDEIYKKPYRLQQLARINFYSNMDHWEVHGLRTLVPKRVSVLDGFAQFFRKEADPLGVWEEALRDGMPPHHMYDAYAACRMKEMGFETWVLPFRCAHHGGLTSTSSEYDKWLRENGWGGDSEVHAKAHEVIYRRFRDVLPLRVEENHDRRCA